MTQRERQILRLIEADPMISQQQIADELGITRSSAAVHISNLIKKGHIAGKGYVLRTGSYAVVVGGVNVDIGGIAFSPLVAADSNPGTVKISLGGVGRNIAHNLSLLGTLLLHLVRTKQRYFLGFWNHSQSFIWSNCHKNASFHTRYMLVTFNFYIALSFNKPTVRCFIFYIIYCIGNSKLDSRMSYTAYFYNTAFVVVDGLF